jgi:hypothetical protein
MVTVALRVKCLYHIEEKRLLVAGSRSPEFTQSVLLSNKMYFCRGYQRHERVVKIQFVIINKETSWLFLNCTPLHVHLPFRVLMSAILPQRREFSVSLLDRRSVTLIEFSFVLPG